MWPGRPFAASGPCFKLMGKRFISILVLAFSGHTRSIHFSTHPQKCNTLISTRRPANKWRMMKPFNYFNQMRLLHLSKVPPLEPYPFSMCARSCTKQNPPLPSCTLAPARSGFQTFLSQASAAWCLPLLTPPRHRVSHHPHWQRHSTPQHRNFKLCTLLLTSMFGLPIKANNIKLSGTP